MNLAFKNVCACFLVALFSTPVLGVTVSWTDWVSNTNNSALGELTIGSSMVNVEYLNTANHAFVQTGTGVNFWREDTPAPYTSGTIDNAPTPAEQIALSFASTVTVNFSETIINPYIAMNSWNGNTVDFLGTPIIVDSSGDGYWGTTGTATLNSSGTGFFGNGEFHGVILLSGAFDSFSFTHTSENWHGFTIGVTGLDDSGTPGTPSPPDLPVPPGNPVPEPATMLLFGTGLSALAGYRSRRRKSK